MAVLCFLGHGALQTGQQEFRVGPDPAKKLRGAGFTPEFLVPPLFGLRARALLTWPQIFRKSL